MSGPRLSYGGSRTSTGPTKKKVTVSFIIRDSEPTLNYSGVTQLRADPHTRHLFSAGRDSIIRCWNTLDCAHVSSFDHHTDWVNDIVLCKNSSILLSASSDTTLKVWNVPKATCLSTLKNHKDYVRCLAYSSARDIAASAGLDKIISIWDVNMLTELSSLNNTVTTSPLSGHKDSIYSLAMNDAGSVLLSGSTDKVIRVWDPVSNSSVMKLKGHSDNVRSLVLSQDGTRCVSASSDGTVRLWSLKQQRCVETFRNHDDGVWALAVDEDFKHVYSGGRDKKVFVTDLCTGTSDYLFMESASILSLCLDPVEKKTIWASTTNSHINKWRCSDFAELASQVEGVTEEGEEEEEEGEEGEEEGEPTDVDEPLPLHIKPLATIPGGSGIVDYQVLGNKRQIITKDTKGRLVLWDVLHACKEQDLDETDMHKAADMMQDKFFVPNWFSVEVKTGALTIKLSESDCCAAWVMGCHTNLESTEEIKFNLGALMLKALFEHWTKQKCDEAKAVLTSIPDLMALTEEVGSRWRNLGQYLSLANSQLEEIQLHCDDDIKHCREEVLKEWLKESEDQRQTKSLVDALNQLGLRQAAEKVNNYCKADTCNAGLNRVFFSVPDHTPVMLQEAGDCGTTYTRFLCKNGGSQHEARHVEAHCPLWVTDIVCMQNLPSHPKIKFSLCKYSKDARGPEQLSSQDVLTILKVMDYCYTKVYGDKGRILEDGTKMKPHECMDIICLDQVLDPELDLRTVKHNIWKGGGDPKLFYRLKDEYPASDKPSNQNTVMSSSQNTVMSSNQNAVMSSSQNAVMSSSQNAVMSSSQNAVMSSNHNTSQSTMMSSGDEATDPCTSSRTPEQYSMEQQGSSVQRSLSPVPTSLPPRENIEMTAIATTIATTDDITTISDPDPTII